jgi:hypothetical protein
VFKYFVKQGGLEKQEKQLDIPDSAPSYSFGYRSGNYVEMMEKNRRKTEKDELKRKLQNYLS